VLGLVAYAADTAQRNREADQLVERVVQAQEQIAYSDRRVAATVDYVRPQLFGPTVPQAVRTGLGQLIGQAAAGQVGAIRAQRRATNGVPVLSWHSDARKARAALARYLEARARYLLSVVANPLSVSDEHPELVRLLAATRAAYAPLASPERLDAAFAGGTHPQ
jgi:hypothetical protein